MIYFDHAAATEVLPEIRQKYPAWLEKFSGNPEAAHAHGRQLRQQLAEFDTQLRQILLGVEPANNAIVFRGQDATELINALGLAVGGKQFTAWGSALDHPAVLQMLERNFGTVKMFPLSPDGRILSFTDEFVSPRLIVLTAVQSEIGVRQDLAQLIPQLRQSFPEALIMVDAVQLATLQLYPLELPKPDLLLLSGTKLGSGGGAVLLAVGHKTKFLQEKFTFLRRREHLLGRVNLVQAAALTEALLCRKTAMAETTANIHNINSFLRRQLTGMRLPNRQKLIITVPPENAADNILHIILPGYQSGVLVRMFSQLGTMLASGSACEAESPEPSRILGALGYCRSDSYSGLRLSFGSGNTLAEAENFLQQLDNLLKNY